MTHDSFRFHGYTRGPQTHATRHTALLLCAFNDIWKAEKAKHAFTGGFDPSKHFSRPTLLTDLSAAVAPIIKKVLKPEDVYAHLLFLSEHKIGATDSMVRNHAGPEQPGSPIFQMGKAGEELADIIDARSLGFFLQGDAKNWAAVYLYARLVEAGECSPTTWTPENIESLTGLNRGQINRAIKSLNAGFTSTVCEGNHTQTFGPDCIENEGSRRHPKFKLKAALRVSSAPALGDLDFDEDAPTTVPSNGAGKPAQAAAAFADLLGPNAETANEAPAATAAPPAIDPEDVLADLEDEPTPPEEPTVGAHANIQPEEVEVLRGEAMRLRISLDSLITVIIKGGIETIQRENQKRTEAEAAARARSDEIEAEIAVEEAEILAESDEAARLASEAQQKLDEIRRRRSALDDKRATLEAATSVATPAG
tara:strand:+ start:5683 stop:6951 length:1269 start_codon:yes stop_codon:yes gene_type:complete